MNRLHSAIRNHAVFCVVLTLSLFPRFYLLGSGGLGDPSASGNVRSMLHSWWHFFFVAWDPAGTYMFDKPPLGFWLQTISAYILGFHGFALVLPQAVAGIICLILLYLLILNMNGGKTWAVLSVAVLAFQPVHILVTRSNKIDPHLSMLVLASALLCVMYARGRKTYHLMLAACCAGLAFNVKSFAFAIMLPSLALLVLWSRPWRPPQPVARIVGAVMLFIVVSFAWMAVVDLTPPDQRPRVLNSEANRFSDLMLVHNGISRISHTAGFDPSKAMTSSGPAIALGSLYGGPRGLTRITGEFPGTMLKYQLPLVLAGILMMVTRIQSGQQFVHVLFWLMWLGAGWIAFSISRLGSPHYLELFIVPYSVMVAFALRGLLADTSVRERILPYIGIIGALLWALHDFHSFSKGGTSIVVLVLLSLCAVIIRGSLRSQSHEAIRKILVRFAIGTFLFIPYGLSVVCVRAAPIEGVIPGAIFLELKRKGDGHPAYASAADPYISGNIDAIRPFLEYFHAQAPDLKYLTTMPNMNGASVVAAHFDRSAIPLFNEYIRKREHSARDVATLAAQGELRFVLMPRRRLASLGDDMRALLIPSSEISNQIVVSTNHPWVAYDLLYLTSNDASITP